MWDDSKSDKEEAARFIYSTVGVESQASAERESYLLMNKLVANKVLSSRNNFGTFLYLPRHIIFYIKSALK